MKLITIIGIIMLVIAAAATAFFVGNAMLGGSRAFSPASSAEKKCAPYKGTHTYVYCMTFNSMTPEEQVEFKKNPSLEKLFKLTPTPISTAP